MGSSEEGSYNSEMNERIRSAHMRVAHQLKFAEAIGKSPADLVKELTSLFSMAEEKATGTEGNWVQLSLWNQSKLDQP